ncbi:S1 RNA-binding domain-containing protein [Streptomyces venezuelae]|uniref:S1 RNA-binding domain-containing protein n=1 Tax=Streptomyces venezuelae TaxID=54571 RepID=UPI0016806232
MSGVDKGGGRSPWGWETIRQDVCFVRIADGVEGLLRNSEFRDEPSDQPSQVVREGDEITVRIVEVDLGRHRVALSDKESAAGWETISLETGSDLQVPCTATAQRYS